MTGACGAGSACQRWRAWSSDGGGERAYAAAVARWGIAEDGAVLALIGPDALVDEVVRSLSPPRGLAWQREQPAGDVACSIELVPRPVDRRARSRSAADRDADGLIGVNGMVSVMRSSDETTAPSGGEWRGHGVEVRVDGVARPGGDAAAESAIGLFAAEHLRELVAVHAAVLLMGGGAVLVPGVSHSGKSSLCAAALNAGVVVWSDEFALVHADGQVSAWPRPLRLRTAAGVVRRPLTVAALDGMGRGEGGGEAGGVGGGVGGGSAPIGGPYFSL